MLCWILPTVLLAFLAASACCWCMVSLVCTRTLRMFFLYFFCIFFFLQSCFPTAFPTIGGKVMRGGFLSQMQDFQFPFVERKILCRTWHSSLFVRPQSIFFNLSKGHSMVVQSSDLLIILPNFMLSANSLQVHSLLSSVSLSKMLKPKTCSTCLRVTSQWYGTGHSVVVGASHHVP